MYQSPQYAVPPSGGFGPYGYTTSKTSPQGGASPDYYSRYNYPSTPSPRGSSKRHARTTSQGAYFPPPGLPRFYSSPTYGSPGYYNAATAEHSSPKQSPEYVSQGRSHNKSHRPSTADKRPSSSRTYRTKYDYDDEGYASDQTRRESPRFHRDSDANRYHHDQVPVYGDSESAPRRSRARRASHSTRPTTAPKTARPAANAAPKATEMDALNAGIPAGYSYKNWDPAEQPVMLLGSVFDANSLGKWIYDWTVFHHGPATPMSEIAGDLWLLLIQLAGKVKRAEECLPRIRRRDSIEMIEDFLESGERLWLRLKKLLKACEEFMWKAAERKSPKGKAVAMGKNSGCEFVDSIFGRDRELENTEKLMTGMRLWSMRFDANCEDILRRPSA
jgi:hypothetical protein